MSRNEERFEPVEVEDVTVKKETEAAILCVIEGQGEFWIPKSQIKDESDVKEEGDEGTLVIPAWLADEKDIDY